MTLFNNLFDSYKKYVSIHLLENEHLIRPFFHNFIGCVSDISYLESSHYMPTRINILALQRSATGKGVAAKANYYLLRHLSRYVPILSSMKVLHITKATDARLTGGVQYVKNKIVPYKGWLETHRYIAWDEGSILFRKGVPNTETIRDTLNMALDEPGRASRGVGDDEFTFDTRTSIVLTSYIDKTIEWGILNEGFPTRFLVTYSDMPLEVMEKIWRGQITELKQKDFRELEAIENEIRGNVTILKNLESFNKSQNNSREPFVKFTEDASKKLEMANMKMDLINKFFVNRFSDKKQEVLYSFASRLDIILSKVATHYAFLNGKSEVDVESWKYACDEIGVAHCKSILDLLENVGRIEVDISKLREEKVISIVRSNPNITITELARKLLDLRDFRGMKIWDLGDNSTKQFIKKLILSKKLIATQGQKNTHNLSVL